MRSGGSFGRYLGMNKEKKEVVKVNQITEGVIWQQILIFFLPILFGTFFQQLYNTADAMIVGHFLGKQALAAVGGTTGTLINLLVGFFVGLSSGATVVISQHYGANKEDKVQWAVHTSIAFSILGGIVLTVVGIGCSRWMLELMNTPDDVVNYALIYMRVYFLGTIGNLIYNMGSGILRAVGDAVAGPEIISCPTCGRTQYPMIEIANEVERRLKEEGFKKPVKIAIMGCIVNGPGEASDADIGIAGGKDCAVLFEHGEKIRTLKGDIVSQFVEEIHKL